MRVQKFSLSDANLIKSPGQDADIYVGNLVDERDGGPVTIGYGKYAPGQTLTETMAVDDTMVVLEGRLSVSTRDGTVTAGPGDIVHMPKGQAVTITTEGRGGGDSICNISALSRGPRRIGLPQWSYYGRWPPNTPRADL